MTLTEEGSGNRPLTVLSLSFGADTGGQGVRTAQAFRRHAPDWHVRHAAASSGFIQYPFDLPWRRGTLQRLYESADVIHANNTYSGLAGFERMATRRGRARNPGMVMHHHGSRFRADPWPVLEESYERGAVQLTSTLDLVTIAPDVLTWLPSPYNLAAMRAYRDAAKGTRRDDGRVRIAHAPTSRRVKSTDQLVAAVKILARSYPVDLDLIEGVTWDECLRRKAEADIYFDQIVLGYGGNAVEAWAMGIPVVCGTSDPGEPMRPIGWTPYVGELTRALMLRTFGTLPFAEATHETLVSDLEALVADDVKREQYAALGELHVQRWHDEAFVVGMLQDAYRRAADARAEVAA